LHLCCAVMISQADLKRFASLRQTKFRQKYGQFIVEGRKVVEEVFHSEWEIDTILITKDFLDKHTVPYSYHVISSQEMHRISNFDTPPGVLAVVNKPNFAPPSLSQHLNLVLDQISDPGNLGAILRICDWYGIDKVWLNGDCVDETNPKVIAASMGSFLRVKCFRDHHHLWKASPLIIGAELSGISLYQYTLPESLPTVLIMGSESHGISKELVSLLHQSITIPKLGKAESLNMAVSCAVIIDRLVQK
jgi:TrmH family RNA methyltransferase